MSHQSLIITQKSAKDLSKLQKQFNANVKKINELKQRLADDTEQIKTIVNRIQTEVIPFEKKHNQKIVELIYVFDKHYEDAFFKKKEKEKNIRRSESARRESDRQRQRTRGKKVRV